MFKSKDEMILAVVNSVPITTISSIDTTTAKDAIYFKWRNDEFKLSEDGSVYVLENECAVGSSLAILMAQVIKNYWIHNMC